ncbi:protein binding protein [Bacillus phage vB_BanH_Emiliahah]|nr:peptide synthetase [Bacillus phage vB_BanH_McCartney]UGO49300.1 protein binding protein [Bacillus phage vB_BanH_Emiliahah]
MTNTTDKMFEVATRKKMLFPFRGMISVIDLWDLTTTQLDSVFKTLNAQLKQVSEESLLQVKTTKDKELELQVEIVKYIYSVKVAEKEAVQQEKAKKEEKQKLLAILDTKKVEELQNKSAAEIQAMIDKL